MKILLALFTAAVMLMASKLPITVDNASHYPFEEIVSELDASRILGADPADEAFEGRPTLRVLLKPYETLLLESRSKAGDIALYLSEDGRLSRRVAWDRDAQGVQYRSRYDKAIILTLAGEIEKPYTLLGMSAHSPLQSLTPVEGRDSFVPKGTYVDLPLPKAGIWRLAHRIAFEAAYPKARKAYRLSVQQESAPLRFETFVAFADEAPDAAGLAEGFSHPLYSYVQGSEGDVLRVHAGQDSWLRLEYFGDDVLLSKNSLHLKGELNATLLDALGRRAWSNSDRDAGLKQYAMYQSALERTRDPLLKSALEELSRQSVFMKALYPELTGYEDEISHGRYSIASVQLYEDAPRPLRSPRFAMDRAQMMPQGFFVPIPRQKSRRESCGKSAPTKLAVFKENELSAPLIEKALADVVDYRNKRTQYHLYVHEAKAPGGIEPLTDAAKAVANTLLRMGVQKESIYYHTLANYPGGAFYPAHAEEEYVTLRAVYEEEKIATLLYDTDVAELTAAQKEELRSFARLFSDKTAQIHLFGHTDAMASKAYNTELARNRARGIAAFLVSEGVAAEKLFVHASQEVKQAVKTPDEYAEAYNRRVDIAVVNAFSDQCELALRYRVDAAPYPSSLELTLQHAGEEPYRFTMEDERGNVSEFVYAPAFTAEALREDVRREAYLGLSEAARSTLDGFIEETATITVPLPAGAASLTFWSEGGSGGKLHLRYLQPKSYGEESANAGSYQDTLERFFASLHDDVSRGGDAWREETQGLRQWMQSRYSALLENINPAAKLLQSDFELADRLRAQNEIYKAKQIYRHFLLLSDDRTDLARAYDALCSLSSSQEERRTLDAVWIYRMHDGKKLLELISRWLDEDKSDLAQQALQLYREDENVALLGVRLAYRVRDWQLFDHYSALLRGERARYWQQCRDAYGEEGAVCEKDQAYDSPGLPLVARLIGSQRLESERTGSVSTYAEVRPHYPLHFSVDANTSVRFTMRVKEAADDRLWVRLKAADASYALPLFQTALQPSLRSGGAENVGMSNEVNVHFDTAGAWQLDVPADLLVSMSVLHAAQSSASERVTISKGEDVQAWVNAFDPLHARYADAVKLLWVFDHYYRLRDALFAKAVIAQEHSSDAQSTAIYKKITLLRSMRPFEEVQNDAGSVLVEDAVEDTEDALTQLQKRIVGAQEEPQLLLHDARVQVFEFDVRRSRDVRLDMRYFISPFTAESGEPAAVYVQLDNREKERFVFDGAQRLKQYETRLGAGRHILRCWIETPVQERYVGVELFENGERYSMPAKRIFHLATDTTPVVLRSSRPVLVKALKKEGESVTQSYHYFDGELALQGSKNGTFYRFYELRFDPNAVPLERVQSASVTAAPEAGAAVPELAALPAYSARRSRQSDAATYSVEAGVFHPNTPDEDRLDSSKSLQAQLGLLRHERLDRNDYVRLHWFIRAYDKPLLALQHRWEHLFERYPVTLDMDLNGYFQQDGTLQSGYFAKAEGYYRADISQKSYAKFGMSLFQRYLNLSLPAAEADLLDPLLYTQYKADHRLGVSGYATGYYRPYLDNQGSASLALQSNENLSPDHLKLDLKWQQLYFPAEFDIGYGYRYFFKDADRQATHQTHLLKVGGAYERFMDMQRAELSFSAQKELSSSAFGFALMFTWHFSDNDRYRHFAPSEIPFRTMKYIHHHGQHNE